MNDERFGHLGGELRLRTERPRLPIPTCELAVVVETGLADRDDLRVGDKLTELPELTISDRT